MRGDIRRLVFESSCPPCSPLAQDQAPTFLESTAAAATFMPSKHLAIMGTTCSSASDNSPYPAPRWVARRSSMSCSFYGDRGRVLMEGRSTATSSSRWSRERHGAGEISEGTLRNPLPAPLPRKIKKGFSKEVSAEPGL